MVKAQTKATLRLFKRHLSRFFTIIAIVVVSVGFMSGLGEVKGKIDDAINIRYSTQNVSDFNIKSKNNFGFLESEINYFQDKFGAENVSKLMCFDIEETNDITRIFAGEFEQKINKFELVEGFYPKTKNEILAEQKTLFIKGYSIGEKIQIQNKEYIVSGIVRNPLLTNLEEEPSFLDDQKHITQAIYIDSDYGIVTDLFVTIKDRSLFDGFCDEYKTKINLLKNEMEADLGAQNIKVLSLYENIGFISLSAYGDKINKISFVFVVFFLLVTLLVVYSTMTRLLDEERNQIACQKTLGFSSFSITSRYVFFVFLATLVGGVASLGVGIVLTRLIYWAFGSAFDMIPYPAGTSFYYYLIVFAIVVVFTALLTLITGLKNTNKKPVDLLSPKISKGGKKVLIEKIPFVWNRLSFKHKSTLRNVFLFKSRFFMTVVSIMGSGVLVFGGMSVLDNSIGKENATSIVAIALAIICFSAVLSALVIYNITNINISERSREIATLKVLGYHNKEVCGYIYREVYIMSFIGVLCAIPMGLLFVDFIFKFIDFGSLSGINWWTWIAAPATTMLFSFISALLLKNKIIKIDMNESLKIRE